MLRRDQRARPRNELGGERNHRIDPPHAIRWGYLDSNPAQYAERPCGEEPDMDVLTPPEIRRLLEGDGVAGSRSAGGHSPDALGAQRYGENNAMRRGQIGDQNDEGASGENR